MCRSKQERASSYGTPPAIRQLKGTTLSSLAARSSAGHRSWVNLVVRGLLLTLVPLTLYGISTAAWAFYHEFKSYQLVPTISAPDTALGHFPQLQNFQLRSVHGPVAAWYLEGSKPAAVVVGHGFGASRHDLLPEMAMLHRHGYGVLALDWPGQGQSPGKVTLGEPEQAAIAAAVGWLRETARIAPENIFGLGVSLGGYLIGQYASRHDDIHALVLVGTMPNLAEFTDAEYAPRGRMAQLGARLANFAQGVCLTNRVLVREIGRYRGPLLVVAGARDTVVPEATSRRLFDAANAPKAMLVLGATGHGDFASAEPQRYEEGLIKFFDRVLEARLSVGGGTVPF